jgi:uncharacterized protein (DUF488 family)
LIVMCFGVAVFMCTEGLVAPIFGE